MLLKELNIGNKFCFEQDLTVYTVEGNNIISWKDFYSSELNTAVRSHYNNREVVLVKMNIIEAFQAMKEGRKVRYVDWPKNHFHYMKDGKFYSQSGQCALYDICDLEENKWEEYIDTTVKVKLNNQYEAHVSDKGIQVGCQEFTFEKLDELVNASKKFRKT